MLIVFVLLSRPADYTPSELMQKIYQIIQIFQTLSLLVSEIRSLCVQNIFRFLFGVVFYFTPQLNPFRLIDAYKAATQDKAFIFPCSCSKALDGKPPVNDGQQPPQDAKPLTVNEAPNDGGKSPNNGVPALPVTRGSAE
jgi:hypothetical protein